MFKSFSYKGRLGTIFSIREEKENLSYYDRYRKYTGLPAKKKDRSVCMMVLSNELTIQIINLSSEVCLYVY